MKTVILLILIIAPSSFVLAQDNDMNKSNQLKISPIRIIDPINPGIELGYEKFYAKRYSTQLSAGIMREVLNSESFDDYKGVRLSIEEKYFQKMDDRQRTYVSTELVVLKVNYSTSSLFIKDTALRTPAYGDTFAVAKQTLALNLKYGIQIPVKSFVIDFSVGVGIKYKITKRSGLFDANAYQQTARDANAYDMANAEGKYLTFNLPLNVKFGYIF